ncbi:unnamed protein product [Arctia plantaginis]|uniref:Uncharacterized protein n=1 Tax=Arctia plantaginis TaxID=874455 RepID=A0A8S0Z661_ARCPL|nr:unnamed protein product [Arctia plantaginis]CAB3258359.1 unnamed protein product [Arctia plantaginis]
MARISRVEKERLRKLAQRQREADCLYWVERRKVMTFKKALGYCLGYSFMGLVYAIPILSYLLIGLCYVGCQAVACFLACSA